ncbi:hypothetical protein [Magnetofaba australis]|uniref:Putative type IV pilus assembly PilZ n=1 Tax=Magnetofaba australis IT-1 TaxID=1434232 RepID=A0A1Y2K7D4_9PROT|nr:hypothetical protein [Magnetofaba australis]OSM05237.1 putative type IV pilus assembly PilZ [Magnetofaba australis IT-1]
MSSGKSKGKGFLKSLISGKGDKQEDAAAKLLKEGTVDDVEKIISIIIKAIEDNLPVQLTIGEQDPFTYYTYFEREHENTIYLKEARYVLIAALDPPIGNIKIRNAVYVDAQMFTDTTLVRARLRFQKVRESKIIQLSFPAKLEQEPQKRAVIRAKIDPKWALNLEIIRPSGVKFDAKAYDIGTGGLAFYPVKKDLPRITDGSRSEVVIHWPEGKPIRIDAMLIGEFSKEGYTGYRCRFMIGNYELAKQIEEMVAWVQRQTLKKRTRLFKD